MRKKIAGDITSIVIYGAGDLGSGVALACALKALPVSLVSKDPAKLSSSREWMSKFFDKGVEKGRFKRSEVFHIIGRICFAVGNEQLKRAGLVVECVEGDIEKRKHAVREIATNVPDDCILIAAAGEDPTRQLGEIFGVPDSFVFAKFFQPVPVNGLAEVAYTPETSKSTLESVMDFCMRIGKTPVLCKDKPGFVLERLKMPLILKAMKLCEEGNAPEDIDSSVELGLGHRRGPLKEADATGLDKVLELADRLFEHYEDAAYEPPRILRRFVEEGRLGEKTGRGFYRYLKRCSKKNTNSNIWRRENGKATGFR
ncbi:MAG: 3-hydroxyacyl-CoA dehydrogenase NAD-binding domain-containing protein [Planctomycetota bacterium]|nr:3-hydroxyacyl-CoA dehydrogenase NAD-binding domain-containing protein [Planctomycetota bacterium]